MVQEIYDVDLHDSAIRTLIKTYEIPRSQDNYVHIDQKVVMEFPSIGIVFIGRSQEEFDPIVSLDSILIVAGTYQKTRDDVSQMLFRNKDLSDKHIFEEFVEGYGKVVESFNLYYKIMEGFYLKIVKAIMKFSSILGEEPGETVNTQINRDHVTRIAYPDRDELQLLKDGTLDIIIETERTVNRTLTLFGQIPGNGPAVVKALEARPTNDALDAYLLSGKKQINVNLDFIYTPLG